MQKRNIAKVIVRNMNGFLVGSAATGVLRTHAPRTNNAALNIAIDLSVVISGWAVSGAALEPVNAHADREIDKIADAITAFRNPTT